MEEFTACLSLPCSGPAHTPHLLCFIVTHCYLQAVRPSAQRGLAPGPGCPTSNAAGSVTWYLVPSAAAAPSKPSRLSRGDVAVSSAAILPPPNLCTFPL